MSRTPRDSLTVEDLREMYRLMLLGRRFTERSMELAWEKRLPVGMHPSAGQEAVGVGACFSLRPSDWLLPSLRTTEAFWTRGVTVLQMFNAIMGNSKSINSGKESFHHSGYPELGILAGSAMVGAQIPESVGVGWAMKMKKTDNVMICFFGDGAAGRGDFHEGLNLASLLKVPVVFVCENNLYFQTVPSTVGQPIKDIADRAASYAMPGEVVDGQDVLAVYDATEKAIARARAGEGPTLLECKTYRFMSHYPLMLEDTRPPEEVARWKKRDPISILGRYLEKKGYQDSSTAEAIEAKILKDLENAFKECEATPFACTDKAFTNVYEESIEAMGI
jgi:TPP-dependent pyruvate/acetoin dehydrogenase alpha subunit